MELLTPQETSEVLKVSITTVYRLVERRELPVYRVGRALRFSKQDVADYLASGRVAPASEETK